MATRGWDFVLAWTLELPTLPCKPKVATILVAGTQSARPHVNDGSGGSAHGDGIDRIRAVRIPIIAFASVKSEFSSGNSEAIGYDEFPASAGDVNVGGTVTQIAAGQFHTCALLTTGRVRCWGSGHDGQLGYGNANDIGDDETPASAGDVSVGGTVAQIDAGAFHTCALLATGRVRCWGNGSAGSLGYFGTYNIGDNELPSSVGNVIVGD